VAAHLCEGATSPRQPLTSGAAHPTTETIGLIVQDDARQAFAWLTGSADLLGGFEDVRRYWRDAYAAYFPSPEDQANVAFIEVRVERMALWIKGVTPEPFGIRPTYLERGADNIWQSRDPARLPRGEAMRDTHS